MPDLHWDTKISEVIPNKIMVRGYRIEELMAKVSFSQAIWLVLMGELPDEKLSKLLDVILVSCIDHGAAAQCTLTARMCAATGASVSAAVAVGVASINRHHGGAIEGCYQALAEGLQKVRDEGLSFDEAADALVADYKAAGKRVPGFGHVLHTTDPRTVRLSAACEELGFVGDHLKMARALQEFFAKKGKRLPLNIDGALGAVLGDLGVPAILMNGFFMISRVPGLLTHVAEEITDMRPLRTIHPTDHGYSGPPERHVD